MDRLRAHPSVGLRTRTSTTPTSGARTIDVLSWRSCFTPLGCGTKNRSGAGAIHVPDTGWLRTSACGRGNGGRQEGNGRRDPMAWGETASDLAESLQTRLPVNGLADRLLAHLVADVVDRSHHRVVHGIDCNIFDEAAVD